jgi:LPPG:FO 2-phospho-L-lactate transferase
LSQDANNHLHRFVALAGGVGGAKLADGLAGCLPAEAFTVVVNSGDDFEHLGLTICPDLDTVCYTLGGIANPETGWGRADETFHALQSLAELGGPDWFRLGDRDLGTHLERTRRLQAGEPLSQVTRDFCRLWSISCTVLPASDDPVPTQVITQEGEMPFQEYFVHRRCQPQVTGFRFAGVAQARPAPGVMEALHAADLVVLCPSNPWVSIDPILALPGIKNAVSSRPVLAVSPIIGGQAVKGPAAKMYRELGIEPSALAIARHYAAFLNGIVIDRVDEAQVSAIQELGIVTLITDTLMKSPSDRLRLANEVVRFAETLQIGSSRNNRGSDSV